MPNFEMPKSREPGTIAEISPHLSATKHEQIESWVAQTNESKPQDNRDYKNDDEPGPQSNSKQFQKALAKLNHVYNEANADIHHGSQAPSIDFELEQASRRLYTNEIDRQFQGWTNPDTNTDTQVRRAKQLFDGAKEKLDTRQEDLNFAQRRLDIVLSDKKYLDDNKQPIEPLREMVTGYNAQLAKSREQFTTDQKLHLAGEQQTQIIVDARRLDRDASQIHKYDKLLSDRKGKIERESERINKQKTELDEQKAKLDEQKAKLDEKLKNSRISKFNPKNLFTRKELDKKERGLNAREEQIKREASQHDILVENLKINESKNVKYKAKLESKTEEYKEAIKHLGYNDTQKTSHNADQV